LNTCNVLAKQGTEHDRSKDVHFCHFACLLFFLLYFAFMLDYFSMIKL
jgi:hypothetical protein